MTTRVETLVVGGGIAGLAAAYQLQRSGMTPWLLVERDRRLGGKITTDRTDGYVVEGGPDCFLGAKPGGIEFCRDLGLEPRLTGTDPAYRRTYVKRDGRLHELPAGMTGLVPSRLRPLLTTSILSVRGRVRAGLELFQPARRGRDEESIAEFVSRRFGREAYDWLVEPLLSGIFAGDGEALSLAATFPQLAAMEQTHGSIIRMMLASRWRTRSALPHGNGGNPAPGFLTTRGGLAEIVDAVRDRLPPEAIRLGTGVHGLRPARHGYTALLDDGGTVEARTVVLAVPAFVAAELTAPFAADLAQALREIPFVSTATVSVGFPARAVPRPLDGYGFVSPRAEGGPVVACTWTSNKFPARVPGDGVLLRFFLGRAGNEDVARAPDDEIRRIVRSELARVHGITAEPTFWKIYRWPNGIPQYTLGHPNRLARIDRAAARVPGVLLAGASYRGVGLPDCIRSGYAAADLAIERAKAHVA